MSGCQFDPVERTKLFFHEIEQVQDVPDVAFCNYFRRTSIAKNNQNL